MFTVINSMGPESVKQTTNNNKSKLILSGLDLNSQNQRLRAKFSYRTANSRWALYPSSHNHGSVENGCISNYEFPFI